MSLSRTGSDVGGLSRTTSGITDVSSDNPVLVTTSAMQHGDSKTEPVLVFKANAAGTPGEAMNGLVLEKVVEDSDDDYDNI